MAIQILGRECARVVYDALTPNITTVTAHIGRAPSLRVIVAGRYEPSEIYIRNKVRRAAECGITVDVHRFDDNVTTKELIATVHQLNGNEQVDGILVQTPLPRGVATEDVLQSIDPLKDADGFHPMNVGILASGGRPLVAPCTPAGCMEMLRQHNINPSGKRVVILGRSITVGRPLAFLLINADATVTVCHSKTSNVHEICRDADILIAAIGKPSFVKEEDVKPGACVIDVGINRRDDGSLVGDVDFPGASKQAGWITPVPGGVGPMTVAMLLHNTVVLANAAIQAKEELHV